MKGIGGIGDDITGLIWLRWPWSYSENYLRPSFSDV